VEPTFRIGLGNIFKSDISKQGWLVRLVLKGYLFLSGYLGMRMERFAETDPARLCGVTQMRAYVGTISELHYSLSSNSKVAKWRSPKTLPILVITRSYFRSLCTSSTSSYLGTDYILYLLVLTSSYTISSHDDMRAACLGASYLAGSKD
jgi:hypothetical protein